MKYWVVPNAYDSNKYSIIGSNKVPNNALCEAPESATTSDGKYITVNDVEENGVSFKVASLDSVQKAIDEQNKADASAVIQYQQDRKLAYPPIGDQLDALYKKLHLGDSTDYDAIAAQIAQVKTDYPKPE